METKPHEGSGVFEGQERQKSSVRPGTFKLKLSLKGVTIGWLGRGGSEGIWVKVVPNEADAVPLEWYAYNKVNYLMEYGFGYMTWSGLSGHPVAINSWSYACGFTLEGERLFPTGHPDMPLSLYDSNKGWLYANGSYSILGVTLVNIS
jgi:hypothetical protein